jgi:hypothetical protein
VENEVHRARFVHPCPKGSNCPIKDTDQNHAFQFIHPTPSSTSTRASTSNGVVPAFIQYPGNVSYSMTNNLAHSSGSAFLKRVKCPNGVDCSLKNDKIHNIEYYHPNPCPNGIDCSLKDDKVHNIEYYHPNLCPNGADCSIITDEEHKKRHVH